MGIRLLIGVCYYETVDLPDMLLKNGVVEFCFNAHCFNEDSAFDTPNNIHFPRNIGKTANYSAFCDMDEAPSLSEEDIKTMERYLPMAMNISQRLTNFPINIWEEEKFKAYAHWRFWKHIFVKYKINAVFFEAYPHSRPYHWFIYAVAREMNIPILMLSPTYFSNRFTYGDSIESQSAAIKAYYDHTAKAMDSQDCILEGSIKEAFERYQNIESDRGMSSEHAQAELRRTIKTYYGKRLGPGHFLVPYQHLVRKTFGTRLKYLSGNRRSQKSDAFADFVKERRWARRIQDYLKHDAVTLYEYNQMAQLPDFSESFIYFGLQLTPEGSTFPMGGYFCDQITSIQLLARAAEKCGVKVYVKEHYVQAFRSRWFYETVQKIKNVRLIKTGISSAMLMKNCIAAATQTGSCMVESAFFGKPALVTSAFSMCKDLPNVTVVRDEVQAEEAIRTIQQGFEVDMDDIKRFFYAIQMSTIFGANRNGREDTKLISPDEYWKGLQSEADLIARYFKTSDQADLSAN